VGASVCHRWSPGIYRLQPDGEYLGYRHYCVEPLKHPQSTCQIALERLTRQLSKGIGNFLKYSRLGRSFSAVARPAQNPRESSYHERKLLPSFAKLIPELRDTR